MARLRAVALLARVPGLEVLRGALIGNPQVELVAVFTHGRRPKAEGSGARPELAEYRQACAGARVPLHVLDGPQARDLENHLPDEELDLLLSLSWRYILPKPVLDRARIAAINLHRGALPAYGGAEPVRRAIEAGERRVAVTAHRMVEAVDAGPVLAEAWLDIDPLPAGRTAAGYAEDIKGRLVPLYAPLARKAIAAVAP